MHIVFFTDNFPPEVNAPASRTFEHCREWVAQGHRVTVITCAPNFPSGRVHRGYRNRLWQQESLAGIRVIRVWSYIAPNAGFWKRILDYLSYMVSAVVAAPFVRGVDVVVGTSPQLFTALAACVAGWMKRVPYVFELRDLWPESIKAVGAMDHGIAIRLLEKLELFLYRKAALIVVVTNSFRERLIERGIDGAKIEVVTNGVDTTRFLPPERDPRLVSRYHLEGKFVAAYIGTHGMAHGLDTLLETAAILQSDPAGEDIVLLLLGDGAEKARLAAEAERRKLANVRFVDSVAKEAVVAHWGLADVAVIHLRRMPLFETVIPSKLFEAMSLGRPVLHGVHGESAEIVTTTGCGIPFEPEDAAGLSKLLLQLRSDRALLARLSQNGSKAAKDYDRSKLAKDMLHHIMTIEGLEPSAANRAP
jgi:glycosyltransferase involved in cell wall biosynthesis